MKKYLSLLENTPMFQGIQTAEILSLMHCLHANIKTYRKGDYILRYGDTSPAIGMVLTGQVLIEKENYWGNRAIFQEIDPGFLFAESYACLKNTPAEVNVVANGTTEIMFFDFRKILCVCSSACSFHTQLIQNLLGTLAQKNLHLTKKVEYLSKKTIQERLLAYLSTESQKRSADAFTIPFDRQQLADFLSVDRSALSHEISKLQKKGTLSCKKNHFTLHKELPPENQAF